MKLTILTVTNNKYFYFLEKLIASVLTHCPKAGFYIELVNVPKYKIEWLSDFFSTYQVNAQLVESNINFCSFEQERGYCTNRRVHLLRDNLVNCDYNTYYLYLDVNTLICGDVENYLSQRRGVDAFLIEDKSHYASKIKEIDKRVSVLGPLKTPYFGIMTAGVQIYKASENSIKFLSDYFDTVGADNCSWYADQEGLYLSLLKNPNFNYLNLSEDNIVAISCPREIQTLFICVKGGKGKYYDEAAMELFHGVEKPLFNVRENRIFRTIVELTDDRGLVSKMISRFFFYYNRIKNWKIHE